MVRRFSRHYPRCLPFLVSAGRTKLGAFFDSNYFAAYPRSLCESQVKGFRGGVYEGYKKKEKAEQAFKYATERCWTRSKSTSIDDFKPATWPNPIAFQDPDQPQIVNRNTDLAETSFMPRIEGGSWYVVLDGFLPGVYGTW